MPSHYEFSSFQSVASASASRQPLSQQRRPLSAPWVPNGQGQNHIKSKGLPTKAEAEAAAAQEDRAASASAVERALLHATIAGAEEGMTALEGQLDSFVGEVEQHFVSATAVQALVDAKLANLCGRAAAAS